MDNILFRLPDYEVIIHIKVSEFSTHLEKEIQLLTTTFELDESTESDGYRDYHWMFKTWGEAVFAAEILKRLINNPNLVLLKVKSNCDAEIQPISYKDITLPYARK